MPVGKKVAAGLGVAVIVVVALAAYLLFFHPQPNIQELKIDSDYAFIVYDGNGQGTLYYVGPNGHLHDLGTYNLEMRSDFEQALNVPQQFNQNVVPSNPNYVPLDQIITIYNKTGVELPVQNNTILLSKLNPESYTDVVVPQGFVNQYMEALGTGNYQAMIIAIPGAQYLQANYPQLYNIFLETGNLHTYSPPYADFIGGYIIQTNNSTLIPYGFLSFTSSQTYGNNLPIENTVIPYNGS